MGGEMPVNGNGYGRIAALGVATIYEAAGRTGLLDAPFVQVIPQSSVAGPARTVACGQGDNLMVHAAIERIQPGEILVLTMPEPMPVALLGELLAIQVCVRKAAAVLVDAAIRDYDELVRLGLPIWARFVRAKGATKTIIGRLDVPVTVGGTEIAPGDLVVLDADGGVCVPAGRMETVLAAATNRAERENVLRGRLLAGEQTFDVHGLRAAVEQKQGD
jgi:4-hydroxy-4-methyl-2-oxoglutarate aldolase